MKKGIIVTTVALIAALSIATASQAATYLSIATGGTSGTYYAVGGALASAVTKGGKIQCTAETGNASVANANLIATKGIEIAFVQNDITHWAYNGELMFQGKPLKNIRTVASLYPENVQVVVAKDAGIKSISDLKGKRVGVGAPGSGVEGDVQAIFKLAGLTYKDLKKADFLDFAAVTSRFKDNQIDAGFVVAGFPTASIMDLTTTKDVDLLNFDDAFLAKLHKAYPFFVPSTIPAKTYKGIDKDTKTPAVMAILITNDSVPADQIYDFLTAMFDNLKDIAAVHAKGKEITLKGALDGLTAPLHPGAEKFYKEKGLIK
ncbi:TAXI family TRAP transporter solute-binding subunit [Synergistes jonesii]|uniref:C4-dicarboxylate ABC transporter substrate-binding protein n=1 Tax=Synergistes jonesii TaxID=2754 RepID=A0A073IUK7_9BACT|nr:TAXI family TRAP transporter solute-binding subunit [Synergistes jonesii]KEJ93474.1 C4-dicarboxylate ABC transporter substrate-binding protein [Synergistes jonesii]OFB65263.1 C4-dicarboxylate ABC transporter substrate-binding protein [Synergistes jonesii]OFB68613.1 C4-dicarboxylate ABC transporter substrate-binding protein [Synergistes jonesii]OFB69279.1 C4-dicarboxylate ABC transporter substrate-binding protein [Synergistes jonesii]OFB76940.1 C4-dicarboxylate ABC transporter substrate-bind